MSPPLKPTRNAGAWRARVARWIYGTNAAPLYSPTVIEAVAGTHPDNALRADWENLVLAGLPHEEWAFSVPLYCAGPQSVALLTHGVLDALVRKQLEAQWRGISAEVTVTGGTITRSTGGGLWLNFSARCSQEALRTHADELSGLVEDLCHALPTLAHDEQTRLDELKGRLTA